MFQGSNWDGTLIKSCFWTRGSVRTIKRDDGYRPSSQNVSGMWNRRRSVGLLFAQISVF